MKFFSKYPKIFDLFFIFILSLTPLFWFRKETIMVGHDNVFPLNPIVFLSGRLSTWIEHGFGISQTLILGSIPIHIIDALPSFFGIPLQVNQMIVYVFWFFMMGFSAYYLASVLNPQSRIFKLTATILYQFNFFILQGWWIGERTKFSAYIAMPFMLAVYFNVYKKDLSIFKAAILNTLVLFIFNAGGLFGIPLFGGFFIAIFIFNFFFSMILFRRKKYREILNLFLLTLYTIIGYILINAYFILPMISQLFTEFSSGVAVRGGVAGLISWASEISAYASFSHLLRLQGIAEWYDNREHPFAYYYLKNPILIFISFIFPLITFLTLVIIKSKEKLEKVLYFFIIYLSGMLIAAGTHPPFGFVYKTLINLIPGFVIFRTPYFKFAPAIFLASAFLIAYFFDHFKGRTRKPLFIGFIALVLLYHFPFFTGEFFSWREGFSTRLVIPGYVYEFENWVNNEKTDTGRVLLLPHNSFQTDYSVYKWGYLSFQSLPTLFSNKSIVTNNDRATNTEKELLKTLYTAILNGNKQEVDKIASSLRIQYFLLQNDFYYNLTTSPSVDSETYKSKLENDLGLLREKRFGMWDLYKTNNLISPEIFSVEGVTVLSGESSKVKDYANFFIDSYAIVDKNDGALPEAFSYGSENEYYYPYCLNCPERRQTQVVFPKRIILPDSILYPLVIFLDERKISKTSSRSRIYDNIGLSLKRLGEILQLLELNRIPEKEVFDRYDATIIEIGKDFKTLTKFEDKLNISEDIYLYITEERDKLLEHVGTTLVGGSEAASLSNTLQEIENLLKIIDPFRFKRDLVNNRLYKVSIPNERRYELFIKGDEFNTITESSQFHLEIDDNRHLINTFRKNEHGWLSLGEKIFTPGDHTVFLSFPASTNRVTTLNPISTEMNQSSDNKCYGNTITDISYPQIYRTKISYINDFSNDLTYYLWEIKNGKRRLDDYVSLKYNLSREEKQRIIKPNSDATGIMFAVCSKNLSENNLHSKITIEIQQMIYPSIVLTPVQPAQSKIQTAEFRKIHETKYEITMNNVKPTVLILNQHFDSGWRLEGFDNNHFKVNYYANGWYIDKTGNRTLILEYAPQKTFYIGAVISVMVFLGCVSYALFYKKNVSK